MSELESLKASISERKIRLGLIILIASLSAYYLTVLYHALTPKVSPAYQAYYLKKETLFWQTDRTNLGLQLPLNKDISLISDNPFLSRQGWNKKEQKTFRTLKSDGGIYFYLTELPKSNIMITLTTIERQQSPIALAFIQSNVTQVTSQLQPIKGNNLVLKAEIPLSKLTQLDISNLTEIFYLKLETKKPLKLSTIKFTTLPLSTTTGIHQHGQ
ncbi:hypothetical protein L0B53_16365 [Vibrio sp. SS-MA-C1-2]|uniref:hypothetical protein n=1 Tax=Vibrio sp. SS-MA-C1-2 TaxID=2908646 RepID=UPI001F1E6FA5|nr:hypothetical protein [Vibrio sp. SS-MA-C1-2]UJF18567.1 hypothetical protein L0B53_16365 [Vibrio sp. SS-MA-C1-2]